MNIPRKSTFFGFHREIRRRWWFYRSKPSVYCFRKTGRLFFSNWWAIHRNLGEYHWTRWSHSNFSGWKLVRSSVAKERKEEILKYFLFCTIRLVFRHFCCFSTNFHLNCRLFASCINMCELCTELGCNNHNQFYRSNFCLILSRRSECKRRKGLKCC